MHEASWDLQRTVDHIMFYPLIFSLWSELDITIQNPLTRHPYVGVLAISFSVGVDAPVPRTRFLNARMSPAMHIWQRRRSNLEFIHDEGVQSAVQVGIYKVSKYNQTWRARPPSRWKHAQTPKPHRWMDARRGSEDSIIFTCGEAMQVNKSSFFSSFSFSILLKLSLRSKITIKVFIADVLDHNSGKCDHLWPDVTSCDHMWPSVTI